MTNQLSSIQVSSTGPAWRRALRASLRTRAGSASLVLRLTLALALFPHGAQKLAGWFGGYGFSGTMGFFDSLGVPAALATLVILLEFFGPILLLLGLATRWVAAGFAGIMLAAIAMVHAQYGFFMNWFGAQKGEGFEYHLLVIGMALALVIMGAGRVSLDARLAKREE